MRELAFQIADGRAAAALCRDQSCLHFDRRAEGSKKLRLLDGDLATKLGHVLFRNLWAPLHLRTSGEPADSVEVFGVDA